MATWCFLTLLLFTSVSASSTREYFGSRSSHVVVREQRGLGRSAELAYRLESFFTSCISTECRLLERLSQLECNASSQGAILIKFKDGSVKAVEPLTRALYVASRIKTVYLFESKDANTLMPFVLYVKYFLEQHVENMGDVLSELCERVDVYVVDVDADLETPQFLGPNNPLPGPSSKVLYASSDIPSGKDSSRPRALPSASNPDAAPILSTPVGRKRRHEIQPSRSGTKAPKHEAKFATNACVVDTKTTPVQSQIVDYFDTDTAKYALYNPWNGQRALVAEADLRPCHVFEAPRLQMQMSHKPTQRFRAGDTVMIGLPGGDEVGLVDTTSYMSVVFRTPQGGVKLVLPGSLTMVKWVDARGERDNTL